VRLLVCLVFAGLASAVAAACSSFDVSTSQLDGGRGAADAVGAADVRMDARSAVDSGHPVDAVASRDANMETGRPDATTDGTSHDAGTDADPQDTGVDARPVDSAVEAGISSLLSQPSLDAATCSPVGNIVVCSLGGCLVTGPGTEGRCQTCSHQGGDCGGHKGASCARPEDCDIGWACYAGSCTLMCPLDAGVFCGNPAVCVDVGNAIEGVCEE